MVLQDDTGDHAADNWSIQLRKGSLDLAVLAVIGADRRYGLEIMKALGNHPGLAVPEGTLYPLLRRLSRDGWVDSEWIESASGHPRKYYRLTAVGHHQLIERARAWTELARSLQTLLDSYAQEPAP